MIAHGKEIKVFTANSNIPFARGICTELGLELGDSTVTTFADGEVSVSINETVRGCDVFVIQSTCNPINNNLMDVYWMIFFGILGYLMKLYHFPVAPAILGIILVDLIELNFRRAALTVGNSLTALATDLVSHPISLVLLVVIVCMSLSSAGVFKKLRGTVKSSVQNQKAQTEGD